MTQDEAEKAGIDTHRHHFRLTDDKANLVPAAEESEWFQFHSVNLPNGDNVGAVARWEWPSPLDDVSVNDLREVQKTITGKEYRRDIRAKDWIGHVVASVLDLELSDASAKAKVIGLIDTWIKNGALSITKRLGSAIREREYMEVGRNV